MPKVLRIINRFNLGGPTYNVGYLSKYLYPNYETLLLGGSNDKYEASSNYILKDLGLHILQIPEIKREINGYYDFAAFYKIKNIIKRYKPDIVHTHASKAGLIGRYAAICTKVPVIVHTFHGHIFHSYFCKPKTLIFKKTERYLAKKSSGIIAVSNTQKNELCAVHKIVDESKCKVVPLGFDLDRFQENYNEKREQFRTQYNISDKCIAISIVGRLVHIKNHALFIRAISKIKEKTGKQIKAFIVGDGILRESLVKLCENLNLSVSVPEKPDYNNADIIFTSWIEQADLVFAGTDITALTSLNEGTPVAIIEAQAACTPVVTTDVGGIRDIVIENETALLARNNDLADFSEKLLKLIENDELRNSMSKKGWDFVKEKHHYKRLVVDMKNLYDDLLCKSLKL